jgi:hypothetical protein
MFNKNLNPILHSFAGKFENLVTAHTGTNQNYKKGYIFNNKAFTFGVRSREVLDEMSWEVDFNAAEKFRYYNLKFNDVFDEHGHLKGEFVESAQQFWEKTWENV